MPNPNMPNLNNDENKLGETNDEQNGTNTNVDPNQGQGASGTNPGGDDSGDAGDGNPGDDQDGDQNGRTFTQDEVSRMMAKEKKQGRNSAFNELGINPNDRRMLKLIKSLVATQKEEDKNGDGETVDEKLLEAEHRAMMAELKADILAQNIQTSFIDDAVTLVSTRLATEEGIDAASAISDLKKKYPAWFTDTGTEEEQKAKRGTGSSIGAMANQAGKSGKDEQASFGKRLAASRRASSKSGFSYFGNNK